MTELPLRFLLAVHNHQPVGNFESVFLRGFEECYRPFLRAALGHPSFRFAAHYSGPLLEHMRLRQPESWEILKELAGRGQVELLGGGFYEPILTLIPERDRLGQLDMMSAYLEEHFHVRPRGIWLTERVWEPTLPSTLARAGVEFTLLDEEHFHYAGIRDIHTTYVTEDQGAAIRIFPIDKRLRYLIPFHSLEDLKDDLDAILRADGLAILGDDGEKFGMWPGTNDWVYGRGWLERFFRFIEENGVRMTGFSEILDSERPAGRVYLPPASYEEMMEWVLSAAEAEAFRAVKASLPVDARRFLRGGMFRDFLVKYPESNRLHKRMLLASRRIEASGDAEARKELYQGQCNDSLWHGIFGGLYLPHLRESSYAHLLEAEKTLPGESERGWTIEDYDADGEREGTIRGRTFALIVKPHPGGALAEIDHYPLARNLVDVLARRRESYHTERAAGPAGGGGSIHELARNLPEESGKRLRYDEHERLSGLDRVYDRSAAIRTLDDVASLDRVGFASRPYSLELAGTVLRTRRSGEASLDGGPFLIDVEKTFALEDAAVRAFWSLTNRSGSPVEFLFGVEWNLYQTREELRIESPKATLCGGRLCLCADGAEIVAFPVETLSQSEQGYDVIHQGYCLLALWPVSIPAGGAFRTGILLGDAS